MKIDFFKWGFVAFVFAVATMIFNISLLTLPLLVVGGALISIGMFKKVDRFDASKPSPSKPVIAPTVNPSNISKPDIPSWSPNPYSIGFGAFTLISLFFLPIIPLNTFFQGNQFVTLAKYFELCESPQLYTCQPILSLLFYLGLLVGAFFIIIGLCAKK